MPQTYMTTSHTPCKYIFSTCVQFPNCKIQSIYIYIFRYITFLGNRFGPATGTGPVPYFFNIESYFSNTGPYFFNIGKTWSHVGKIWLVLENRDPTLENRDPALKKHGVTLETGPYPKPTFLLFGSISVYHLSIVRFLTSHANPKEKCFLIHKPIIQT